MPKSKVRHRKALQSVDPIDATANPQKGQRLAGNPRSQVRRTSQGPQPQNATLEAAIEEFGRDGMGVAPKE